MKDGDIIGVTWPCCRMERTALGDEGIWIGGGLVGFCETSIHKKKGANNSMYERIYINKRDLEIIKPSLKSHMHESMYYKINENIKQDSSDIESDIEIMDIYDIGGS